MMVWPTTAMVPPKINSLGFTLFGGFNPSEKYESVGMIIPFPTEENHNNQYIPI